MEESKKEEHEKGAEIRALKSFRDRSGEIKEVLFQRGYFNVYVMHRV